MFHACFLLNAPFMSNFATPVTAVKELSSWEEGIITHDGGQQDGMNPSDPSFGMKEVNTLLFCLEMAISRHSTWTKSLLLSDGQCLCRSVMLPQL